MTNEMNEMRKSSIELIMMNDYNFAMKNEWERDKQTI